MSGTRNSTIVRNALAVSIAWGIASASIAAELADASPAQEQASNPPSEQNGTDAAKKTQEQAASNDPVNLGAVTVTGYARSLEAALNEKRYSDVISDGISAEGVGKFPEQNIADSLARVTGVQLSRNKGRGEYISIRGLAPQFTNTLYNGRQIPSGSGSRAFNFQVIPANFVNQANVYKSPTSDLLESGLAATVNIQSANPLDVGTQRGALNVEGVYNSLAKGSAEPHVSGLYMNTYMDGRLGFSIALDYNNLRYSTQEFDANFSQDGLSPDLSPDKVFLRLFHLGHANNVGDTKRISGASTLQFKAADNLEFKLDTIVSSFKDETKQVQGFSNYPNAGALGAAPTDTQTIGPQNAEVAWQGSNVYSWVQTNYHESNDHLKSTALSGTWTPGSWTIEGEASYSKATRKRTSIYPQFNSPQGRGQNVWYDTTQNRGGPVPYGYWGGYDPNDPENYVWNSVYVGAYKAPTTDEIENYRFDATRSLDVGWLDSIKFGANYVDRTLSNEPNSGIVGADKFPDSSVMRQYLMLYPNFFSQGQPSHFTTVNLADFLAAYPIDTLIAESGLNKNLSATTSVQEKAKAAYVRADFSSEDDRWRGNAGVRFVRTEEISMGYGPTPDATIQYPDTYTKLALVSHSNTYNNVLPSLNMSYRITDDLIARFAVARVLQRPDLHLLTQNSTPSIGIGPPPDGSVWAGGQLREGNPNLKPYLSDQFDLSLEWYFNKRGILAAGVWQKDVKDWVLTDQYERDTVAYIPLTANVTDPTLLGRTLPIRLMVSQPVNATKVKLRGLELGYEQAFDFLPGFLSGFGAQANYTYIDFGDVKTATNSPASPLPNISKNTYNVGLYYDTGTFDIRANYNYRSEFLISNQILGTNLGGFTDGYGQIDVSASYKINDNLSIYGSVSNLQNQEVRNSDVIGTTTFYQLNGRNIYLGARFTF